MSWTLEQGEEHLLSRELFGMRFGLDRIRRLLTALGSPQERFRAIHVVGTNGKSSTTRMAAAVLEAHGHRTGAFLSPHLTSYAERIRIGNDDLGPDAFGAAVERAAAAATKVERTLPDGERVTQFELLVGAGFCELARRGVEIAVVEAGLGGRHDATAVLQAPVVVLTNVGLEHTRWLGPTIGHIAREKLAVVHPPATLILGDASQPEVVALAHGTGATVVEPAPVAAAAALPGYQQRNFAVAVAAAEALAGPLDPARVAEVAAHVSVPGRMQIAGERPLTILDGAHNPSGIEALAAALPARDFVGVVSILDDKDAGAMLGALAARCRAVVCTAAPSPRALPPATLASLAGQLGMAAEVVADPHAALARGRALAGPDGAVVATGSIYLIAALVSDPGSRRASVL
jgi:dihydrofolate synthase/folylpolyglutamate synthase